MRHNIDKIITDLRDALRAELNAAYERGKADEKAELLDFLASSGDLRESDAQYVDSSVLRADNDEDGVSDVIEADIDRKRAPRGLPRVLAERVMKEYEETGCTPAGILEQAQTDYEKMIKLTSIRSELRKGEKDGRYREHGGLWFLTEVDDVNESFG